MATIKITHHKSDGSRVYREEEISDEQAEKIRNNLSEMRLKKEARHRRIITEITPAVIEKLRALNKQL